MDCYLLAEEWRVLSGTEEERVVYASHKSSLVDLTINNFLSFRAVRIVEKSIDELLRTGRIEHEAEFELVWLLLGRAVVFVRKSNHSEDLVPFIGTRRADMDLIWSRFVYNAHDCFDLRHWQSLNF